MMPTVIWMLQSESELLVCRNMPLMISEIGLFGRGVQHVVCHSDIDTELS